MMERWGVEKRAAALTAAMALGLACLTCEVAASGIERASIAVFRDWGAFREGPAASPGRCYAIAEPPPGSAAAGRGAFASVASWPGQRIRAQVAIRLSHAPQANTPVTLSIGDASFPLVAHGQQAWASDRHQDARVVSAMRSGSSMSVSGVSQTGVPFADAYRLRGAASAIDAALLACPMR